MFPVGFVLWQGHHPFRHSLQGWPGGSWREAGAGKVEGSSETRPTGEVGPSGHVFLDPMLALHALTPAMGQLPSLCLSFLMHKIRIRGSYAQLYRSY